MLKRALRRSLRKLQKWVREESRRTGDPAQDEKVYPWNAIFMKLIKEGGPGFRANYTWGVLQGVNLAKGLGYNRVSVIEFGVAGGNGLISLEMIAKRIEQLYQTRIDVYGFDTGTGLPEPRDYRDLPNIFSGGAFPMDISALQARLNGAQLILGPVEETVPEFIASRPAPVMFISFDLDFYSATMAAFQLLQATDAILLPRVHCYFDDIVGSCFGDHVGERLAIADFNASHGSRKISPIYGLKYLLPRVYAHVSWTEQFYLAHIFDHELYGRPDGFARRPNFALKGGPPAS